MFVPLPTPAEMRCWDGEVLALGMPEDVLVENAAREAFAVLRHHYGPLQGARVLVVMGGGNNGGDAACLARHLLDAGALPTVAHTRALEACAGAAQRHAILSRGLGVPFFPFTEPEHVSRDWSSLMVGAAWPDIIVDGLLGTGFTGELRGREAFLVARMKALAAHSLVLALDTPSGLNAATGKPCPDAVHARVTVTFQAAKPGLTVPEATLFTGLVEVRPIGIPARVMAENPASFRLWHMPLLDPEEVSPRSDATDPITLIAAPDLTPLRLLRAQADLRGSGPHHKGESGRVFLVGGSEGLSGAPRLAAWGALRGGAGLVTVAAPAGVVDSVRNDLPDVTTIALPRTGRSDVEWTKEHANRLASTLSLCRAAVVGPGMGRGNGAGDALEALLRLPSRPPLILDADALFALGARPSLLALLRRADVLTPHPGEAATLLGMTTAAVQADRFGALASLRSLAEAVWVLKGAGTLVGEPEAPVCICPWHVPNLAVAGSGDVLAGLVGALIAQGHTPGMAACLGVSQHALAGLWLTRDFPMRGNSPRDIADALPLVRPLLGEPLPNEGIRPGEK